MNPGKHYDYFSTVNVYTETENMGAKAVEMLLSGNRDKIFFPVNVEMNNIWDRT
jgi:hypothetical protein